MLIICSIYLVGLQLKWFKCTKIKKKKKKANWHFKYMPRAVTVSGVQEEHRRQEKIQLLEVIKCGWKNKKP